MNQVSLPKNAALAEKVLDHENQKSSKKMDLGLMGWLFGGGSEKSGNIAGFILIACFLALIMVGWTVPTLLQQYAQEVVGSIFSLITLTIGYLFGRKSSD